MPPVQSHSRHSRSNSRCASEMTLHAGLARAIGAPPLHIVDIDMDAVSVSNGNVSGLGAIKGVGVGLGVGMVVDTTAGYGSPGMTTGALTAIERSMRMPGPQGGSGMGAMGRLRRKKRADLWVKTTVPGAGG